MHHVHGRTLLNFFSVRFGSVFATVQTHATIECLLMSFLSLWFFSLAELVWSLHSTHSIAKSVTAIICFDMVALLRRHCRWRQRLQHYPYALSFDMILIFRMKWCMYASHDVIINCSSALKQNNIKPTLIRISNKIDQFSFSDVQNQIVHDKCLVLIGISFFLSIY